MKKYDKYKDSGIEWIALIPTHWQEIKLKYLSEIQTGSKDTVDREEYGIYPFFVRSKNIERINSYSFDGEAILTAGDGDIGKIFHYINGKFDFHQRVYRISNFKTIRAQYLYFFMQSNFYNEVIRISAKSTVDSLRLPMLQNFYCLIPTQSEQDAIANFLNRKASEIERLIEIKEKLVELYEESKTAIINQAVTKGIDPDTEYKNSGIEWFEEIPTHWELKKLRHIGNCQNGISQGADYFGSGYPFVSYSDVYKYEVLPENILGLANSSDSDRINYSVLKGDILFTRTSETVEEIGIASTCMKTIPNAIFSGFLIRVRSYKDILFEGFSKYYFRAKIHRRFFVNEMNLVTRASLSQELLKRMPVLLPPYEEQITIAQHLESETGKIDLLIEKTKKLIELLKEYKTALISEVVTGKIKVTE